MAAGWLSTFTAAERTTIVTLLDKIATGAASMQRLSDQGASPEAIVSWKLRLLGEWTELLGYVDRYLQARGLRVVPPVPKPIPFDVNRAYAWIEAAYFSTGTVALVEGGRGWTMRDLTYQFFERVRSRSTAALMQRTNESGFPWALALVAAFFFLAPKDDPRRRLGA